MYTKKVKEHLKINFKYHELTDNIYIILFFLKIKKIGYLS